jgi:serine/threonine protein kinase
MIEEYVSGTDLTAELLAAPWPLDRSATFFAQLADGLSALAAVDVVHRDLKPANVRVRPDGAPVVVDFGLARLLQLPDLTNTADGAAIGTPAYFAPEQFDGTKRDIDRRTDLFAFGVILYQAVVGDHPFLTPNMTYEQLRPAVCQSEAAVQDARFLRLPSRWQVLIRSLLAKDRASRPTDARIVADLLRRLGGQA